MATDQAQTQVNPGIADRQAFLAPLRRAGRDRLNQITVGAWLLRISVLAPDSHFGDPLLEARENIRHRSSFRVTFF
jgi:hypothetical protein